MSENKSQPSSPRWWDFPAAILLLVALITVAVRLEATNWTKYLGLTQTIVLLGVVAGLALGQSRFSPRVVAFFATVYGAFVVPWQIGLTLGQGIEWRERLESLGGRLYIVANQLVKQEIVQDSLLFLVLMGALFWVLSVYGAYTLVRYGNAWRAILPAGLALFVIHSFDPVIARRAWYLAVFLFFALVLVARMAFLQQHARWKQSRTALPPHLGLDFIRFTLLVVAVIVLFSWTAPALANTLPPAERIYLRIKQPWDAMRDRMDHAFASLRATVGVVSDYYGNSLMLGRGNQLTDTQMFNVRVANEPPEGVRFYWRARVYDTYLGGQWGTATATTDSFDPQQDEYTLPLEAGRWLGTFEMFATSSVTTLYTPSQPIWVSRPSRALLNRLPNESVDISTLRANPPLSPGEVYQVQASLSKATITQLENAGTEYPEWVTERYLQLPESITPRTRQLAEEITAGLETPYQKTLAITSWLRDNIEYTETVPEVPRNRESVDWFLFEYKKGFCNYYSTAEIILLRSIGIPARWAVGYAQGEQLEDGAYVVRQRDAHAWPEVYFPGLGWVEFEPTVSQPTIVRPIGQEVTRERSSTQEQDEEYLEALRRQRMEERLALLEASEQLPEDFSQSGQQSQESGWFLWLGSFLFAGVLLFLAWRSRDRFHLPAFPIVLERTMTRAGMRPPERIRLWSLRASLPPLSKAYMEINHALDRLGSPPQISHTPVERAGMLSRTLPEAASPAERLIGEYQRSTFSNNGSSDLQAANEAGKSIRMLSYQAFIKRFFGKLLARIQRQPSSDFRPWQRENRR